jgi:hypothetical protein
MVKARGRGKRTREENYYRPGIYRDLHAGQLKTVGDLTEEDKARLHTPVAG